MLAVYVDAAAARCPGLPWPVLAAIGAIESGHDPTAIGPALDGSPGIAAIPATRQGTAWHGDPRWERAVGMMQFLPDTFRAYGVAARSGPADPLHPADAAHSAAAYLCANGAADPHACATRCSPTTAQTGTWRRSSPKPRSIRPPRPPHHQPPAR